MTTPDDRRPPPPSLYDSWPTRVQRHLEAVPVSVRGRNRLARMIGDGRRSTGSVSSPASTQLHHVTLTAGNQELDGDPITFSAYEGPDAVNVIRGFDETEEAIDDAPTTDVTWPLSGPSTVSGWIVFESWPGCSSVVVTQIRNDVVINSIEFEIPSWIGARSRVVEIPHTGLELEFRSGDVTQVIPQGTGGGRTLAEAHLVFTQLLVVSPLPEPAVRTPDSSPEASRVTTLTNDDTVQSRTIPAAVTAGDLLILLAGTNSTWHEAVNEIGVPDALAWTQIDDITITEGLGVGATRAWYRVAQASDPGTVVSVPFTDPGDADLSHCHLVLAYFPGVVTVTGSQLVANRSGLALEQSVGISTAGLQAGVGVNVPRHTIGSDPVSPRSSVESFSPTPLATSTLPTQIPTVIANGGSLTASWNHYPGEDSVKLRAFATVACSGLS